MKEQGPCRDEKFIKWIYYSNKTEKEASKSLSKMEKKRTMDKPHRCILFWFWIAFMLTLLCIHISKTLSTKVYVWKLLVSTVSFLSLNCKFVTKRSYWVVVADDALNLSKDGNYWLFNLALKITFSICRSGNISDKGHYFINRRIWNRLSRLDFF